jgi:hypothetical protein
VWVRVVRKQSASSGRWKQQVVEKGRGLVEAEKLEKVVGGGPAPSAKRGGGRGSGEVGA